MFHYKPSILGVFPLFFETSSHGAKPKKHTKTPWIFISGVRKRELVDFQVSPPGFMKTNGGAKGPKMILHFLENTRKHRNLQKKHQKWDQLVFCQFRFCFKKEVCKKTWGPDLGPKGEHLHVFCPPSSERDAKKRMTNRISYLQSRGEPIFFRFLPCDKSEQ